MNLVSVGDMAMSYGNSRHYASLKSDLVRLSDQLASGRRQDVSTPAAGDFHPLVGLERSLTVARSYAVATGEATHLAATMQASLATIQDNATSIASALMVAGTSQQSLLIETTTADAKLRFEAVISTLNVQVAGRYAFSGAATDRRPLQDVSVVLADLKLAVTGQTTAAGVASAVDAWFDTAGGGFDTVAYGGSTTPLAPMRLSDDDRVELSLTAADPDIRALLKGFALAALAGEGVFAAGDPELAALTMQAGERVTAADSRLALVRGRIGAAEARIEEIGARNSASVAAMEMTRTDLTAADPYRTATELEAIKGQLESLYTVTARLAHLSLAELLR